MVCLNKDKLNAFFPAPIFYIISGTAVAQSASVEQFRASRYVWAATVVAGRAVSDFAAARRDAYFGNYRQATIDRDAGRVGRDRAFHDEVAGVIHQNRAVWVPFR
ncbi:MAG: hypothetical protein ACRYFY_05085 [Janthinobacterium lividum]